MKRTQQIVAWLIVLLGLRFWFVAPREFAHGVSPFRTAFWLVNIGLSFVVCGLLILLRLRYSEVAPGIRVVATGVNVAVAVLVLAAGIVGGETPPSAVAASLLLAGAVSGYYPLNRA